MNVKLNNKILVFGVSLLTTFLSLSIVHSANQVAAADEFTIETKVNLEKFSGADKLKVVVSANGENQTKILQGDELKSKSTSVSFPFNQKNDIVTAGKRDEFFACAYDVNAVTNAMKSYSCVEGNIENPGGKNTINIGSGSEKTLSTGTFQTVSGGVIKDPTIRVSIPLSDRKDVKNLRVVAMIRGEFESQTIDAQKLLKQADHNTIIVPLVFDKEPEMGPIQLGDMFFACVSADELNPPEGTECEHRVTVHTGHIHNLVAR